MNIVCITDNSPNSLLWNRHNLIDAFIGHCRVESI